MENRNDFRTLDILVPPGKPTICMAILWKLLEKSDQDSANNHGNGPPDEDTRRQPHRPDSRSTASPSRGSNDNRPLYGPHYDPPSPIYSPEPPLNLNSTLDLLSRTSNIRYNQRTPQFPPRRPMNRNSDRGVWTTIHPPQRSARFSGPRYRGRRLYNWPNSGSHNGNNLDPFLI